MDTPTRRTWALIPIPSAVVAVGYLVSATLAPALLPVLAIAAPVAACALVLANRRSVRLEAALAVTAAWLCIALPGAILLADKRVAGLAWLGGALFLLPLILVPWLYSATFPSNHEPRTTNHLPP